MIDSTPGIPIDQSLLDDTQALAKELDISWSRLITIALGDFVRRYRGRKELTDRINMAYADAPDAEEARLQEGMRATQRKLVEGEW